MAMLVLRVVLWIMGIRMGVRMIVNGFPVPVRVRVNNDLALAVACAAVGRADFARAPAFGTFHVLVFVCHGSLPIVYGE
jgi:hypothetical protein